MTTYTTLSNALVGVGAKPFATTIQALRDNPLAIAEGDATAPKIAFAAIVDGVAGVTAGAVGTYAFLYDLSTGSRSAGATVAGSSLQYSSITTAPAVFTTGATLSGTWRLLGQRGTTPSAAVWLRIS